MNNLITILIIFIYQLFAMNDALALSWIDLPKEDLTTITKLNEEPFNLIQNLSREYHQLDKTKYHLLSKRINKLNDIKKTIDEYLKYNADIPLNGDLPTKFYLGPKIINLTLNEFLKEYS